MIDEVAWKALAPRFCEVHGNSRSSPVERAVVELSHSSLYMSILKRIDALEVTADEAV
jgi:hypothetical protein